MRAAPPAFVEAVDVPELGRDDEPAVFRGNAPAAVLLHGEEAEVEREEVFVAGRENLVPVEVVERVAAVLSVGFEDVAPLPFVVVDPFEPRSEGERAVGADGSHSRFGLDPRAALPEVVRVEEPEGQGLRAVGPDIA